MSTNYFTYTEQNLQSIEDALSLDRFSTYLVLSEGDKEKASELYLENVRLSEALFGVLHIVEVVLRNKIHQKLSFKFGEFWFKDSQIFLLEREKNILQDVHADLSKKKNLRPGDVVAALNFGFWTSLFGRKYEELWRHHLRHILNTQGCPLIRSQVTSILQDLRFLRNRIAHHECIIKMDLSNHYLDALQLVKWLSPVVSSWIEKNNRYQNTQSSKNKSRNARIFSD